MTPPHILPPGTPLVEGDGWRVRVARPDDNPLICELFRKIHLGGDLDVTQERDPDFFALLDLHAADGWLVTVAEDPEGALVGCGTVVVRPGVFDGAPVTTGYLGDLRVDPAFRGGRAVAQAYGPVMERIRAETGAEVFTTVIFDANQRAVRALTGGGQGRRAGQPLYRPMTPFDMVSIQHTRPRPAPSDRVRAATPADRDALLDFLAAGQARRHLGWRVPPEALAARFARWPGFALEDFLLAHDPAGRLVGCLAPWNTAPVKRTRVLGYHGRMRWLKAGFAVAARLGGFPALPPPGACFDFSFLTHLEIMDDDPAVFQDLLRAAYRGLRARGEHFMSACVPRGSRLNAGLQGFAVQRTPMTLYAVHRPESPLAAKDVQTLHPGFEMALS